jgi:hypothetical protein
MVLVMELVWNLQHQQLLQEMEKQIEVVVEEEGQHQQVQQD